MKGFYLLQHLSLSSHRCLGFRRWRKGPLGNIQTDTILELLIPLLVVLLVYYFNMPLYPWNVLLSEVKISGIESGHQGALYCSPSHPITVLDCVDLLHVCFSDASWEVLFILQCWVIKCLISSVLNLFIKESYHLLEIVGQLLSCKNVLEFCAAVLQVIDINKCVLVILPE